MLSLSVCLTPALAEVLVVAGPGAGKTFCLTARIQFLIDKGFNPHRICALTFTNRAAEEIATRLGTPDVSRGTIHASGPYGGTYSSSRSTHETSAL